MRMRRNMTRDDYKRLVDEALQKQFLTDADFPMHGLAEAMRYSLLAGGKRIRPILVLEFCRLSGGVGGFSRLRGGFLLRGGLLRRGRLDGGFRRGFRLGLGRAAAGEKAQRQHGAEHEGDDLFAVHGITSFPVYRFGSFPVGWPARRSPGPGPPPEAGCRAGASAPGGGCAPRPASPGP